MLPNPMRAFQILCQQATNRALTKVTSGHEESIQHFRQAEIEVLRGVHRFMEDQLRALDERISRKQQNQSPSL